MSATAPATSSASSRRTIAGRRSSPISAAGRSAWPSPATARCSCCIGGMGLYRVTQDRAIEKLTDETNRSWFSIIDDSRLRLADDLDIAPDGRVFFSEATIRYEMHEWPVDCLESRGNGRIICFDPNTGTTRTVLKNLVFPNGICMTHDGQSFLFAETWACRVSRYWFDGPKKGTVEPVIADLPGYPDNINRASDGTYWLALVGMRTPSLDLALKMPGFRKRMARRIAPDEWMYPNINTGCVAPLRRDRPDHRDAVGSRRREPSDDHLDARAQGPPLHRRHPQQPHRPAEARGRRRRLDGPAILLGAAMIGGLARALDNLLGRGEAAVTVPPLDGALRPEPHARRGGVAVPARRRRLPRGRRGRARRVGGQRGLRPRRGRRVAAPRRLRGGHRLPCRRSATTGWPSRSPTARSSSRAAASTAAAIAPAPMLRCITAMAVSGTRSLSSRTARRPTAPPTGSATSCERNASGSIWRIDLESGASTQHRRRARLAGRPCGRWRGPRLLRGLEAPAGQDRSCRSGQAAGAPCRPARLSRPDRAGRGRLLAGGVRAAQPARRVRAARARLPQAHDGRGAAAVLGGAEAAGPAAASTSRCRAAA